MLFEARTLQNLNSALVWSEIALFRIWKTFSRHFFFD